ncbi:MAG: zonular occludens toxin domain-containing protein [Gallionella sp.]|nr:zonular occludens toxin domain-containing protein [Gallionella sp.]
MAIWFHEGLPRSGKTYEAVVKFLLPFILQGRYVVTNIKGINCEKIAEITGVPVQEVELLVIIVPWEKSKEIWKYAKTDCLILFDEVQDFFPATRDRLEAEITELITQHGHRGIDIVLMGQALADVHALWRRRVDKKIYFVQKDAVGKPLEYSWQLYKQTSPDKFAQVNSGKGKYEAKYFGTYKSHDEDTKNKETYEDVRANVWNRPALKYGIPAFAFVFFVAVGFLWNLFHPVEVVKSAEANSMETQQVRPAKIIVQTVAQSAVVAVPETGAAQSSVVSAPAITQAPAPADYFQDLLKDNRPRLASYIYSETKKIIGRIDFYKADGEHRTESLTFEDLRNLEYEIELVNEAVRVKKNGTTVLVTSWPLDTYGRAPDRAYPALSANN